MKENTQPTSNQSTVTTSPFASAHRSNKRLWAAVVLVVVAVVLIAWGINKHNDKSNTYKTTYSQFVTDSIAGQGNGNSITFQRPKDFAPIAPGNLGYLSYYGQLAWQPGDTSTLGTEVVASVVAPSDHTTAFITKGFTSSTTSDDYKNSVAPLQKFLSQSISYLYFSNSQKSFSINLSQPAKTTKSGLQNGWLIPFTASGQASSTNQNLNNVKGEMLFAAGKNNYYYVVLSAISSNWDSNHSAWENVFSNVKIDQDHTLQAANKSPFPPNTNSTWTNQTCYDNYNQAFVHIGGCTKVELQSESYYQADGCYNSQGDFLTSGACSNG